MPSKLKIQILFFYCLFTMNAQAGSFDDIYRGGMHGITDAIKNIYKISAAYVLVPIEAFDAKLKNKDFVARSYDIGLNKVFYGTQPSAVYNKSRAVNYVVTYWITLITCGYLLCKGAEKCFKYRYNIN